MRTNERLDFLKSGKNFCVKPRGVKNVGNPLRTEKGDWARVPVSEVRTDKGWTV